MSSPAARDPARRTQSPARPARDPAARRAPDAAPPSASAPTPAPIPAPTRPRTTTFGTIAWLVVVAAVAGVQLSRRAWVDSAVLLVVLVVLLTDATGRLRHRTRVAPRTRWPVLAAAATLGVVLVAAPRHSTIAGVAMIAAGLGALAYAWPDRSGEPPAWDRRMTRTATAWSAAWVAGCLWELAMFVLGGTRPDGRVVYPAASDLFDPLLANSLVKAGFVVVWLTVGVTLLARVDRR